jgi:NADH-quinone oxidoreductase subunit G
MPKCTINGQEVEVKDGATIMEAFYKLNENIAHYCYHPGLSVAGVCRLCIVDIEGNPRPQIACNTVVTEGMKVSNKSERIKDGVKWVLDFHLINHPLDCPICDQAGECGYKNSTWSTVNTILKWQNLKSKSIRSSI